MNNNNNGLNNGNINSTERNNDNISNNIQEKNHWNSNFNFSKNNMFFDKVDIILKTIKKFDKTQSR